ncbi:MAG: MGH1-like glycoside hydrolase domain-containing protein, partial [Nitrososphaerales archaeon]
FVPWYLHVVDGNPRFDVAWHHLLSPTELGGPFGMRTNEPSYQYFMRQYRYDKATGLPECQWNGPAWPFQTSQVLTGMANALNDPAQRGKLPFSASDYLRLLRQYTQLHFLNGRLDLQEDYNAQTGRPIVGLPRSHHYNHSTYNDLIVTGLAGLRPRADNTLKVNPLLPARPGDPQFIRYFCLENIPYHGHLVTILYDFDGKRYGRGAGLSLFVDGRRVAHSPHLGPLTAKLSPASPQVFPPLPVDLAVNVVGNGYPKPSASIDNQASDLYSAVDGRIWYFPEIANGWSTTGSHQADDWYSLDLGKPTPLGSAQLFFFADGRQFVAPSQVKLQYWDGAAWKNLAILRETPRRPIANGPNALAWPAVTASKVRLIVAHTMGQSAVRLVEMKLFAPQPTGPSPH